MSYLKPFRRAFMTRAPMARPMRRLLLACAVVPFAGDLMVTLGARLGLYSLKSSGLIHVIFITVVLVAITIEVGRMLQRSEARLQLQIDRMPIACMTTAPDFTITSWNPAAARIFGYSDEEIVGQSASRLLPDGARDGDLEAVWERLLAGDYYAHSINENVTKERR